MGDINVSINMDQNNNKSPLKKLDINRKKRKPLMEKRRRARINASLEQLKKLVLDATRKDSARYSKLEKADILELTVRHLRDIQRNNFNYAVQHDPNILAKFGDGYGECATEVGRYLSTTDGVSKDVHARIMNHLSNVTQKAHVLPNPGIPNAVRIPGADFPSPNQHMRVPPPHPSFVLNRQGMPIFQGMPPQHAQIPNGIPPMMTPLTPTGHMSPTSPTSPVALLPPNSHYAHMKHSPPTSPPHDLHERIFHTRFSTVNNNSNNTSDNESKSIKSEDCKRQLLSNPEDLTSKTKLKGVPTQDKGTSQMLQKRNNTSTVSSSHSSPVDQILVKSEIKQEEQNLFRRENEHLMMKHVRFFESVQLQQGENVWRPW